MCDLVYRVGPLSIAIRTTVPHEQDAVGHVFDSLGFSRAARSESEDAAVTVSLALTEASFRSPSQAAPRLYVEGEPSVWRNACGYFVKGPGSAWAEVHVAARQITLLVPPFSAESVERIAPHLLFPLTSSLTILLHIERYYLLHAACLLPDAESDDAVLFVAESDRGKSTLAFSLLRQGWRYLSDDAVLLYGDGKEVSATPYRRSFGLDKEAKEHFPELRSHSATQLTEADKLCIDTESYYEGRIVERATPRVLIVPRIADRATSRLEPLSQKEALHTVMHQSGLLTLDPAMTPFHFKRLVQLCTQARLFRLEAGRDVIESPANVVRLLHTAWQG